MRFRSAAKAGRTQAWLIDGCRDTPNGRLLWLVARSPTLINASIRRARLLPGSLRNLNLDRCESICSCVAGRRVWKQSPTPRPFPGDDIAYAWLAERVGAVKRKVA
jgi:hypothetical protein